MASGSSTGEILPCPQSRTCIEIRKVSRNDRQLLPKSAADRGRDVMPIIPESGYLNFTRGTGVMVMPLPPATTRNAYNPGPLPSNTVIGTGRR